MDYEKLEQKEAQLKKDLDRNKREIEQNEDNIILHPESQAKYEQEIEFLKQRNSDIEGELAKISETLAPYKEQQMAEKAVERKQAEETKKDYINSITDYTKLQREADSLREKIGEYEDKLFSGNLNATQYAKYQQLLESAEKELELYEDRLSEIAREENEQSSDKEETGSKMSAEQSAELEQEPSELTQDREKSDSGTFEEQSIESTENSSPENVEKSPMSYEKLEQKESQLKKDLDRNKREIEQNEDNIILHPESQAKYEQEIEFLKQRNSDIEGELAKISETLAPYKEQQMAEKAVERKQAEETKKDYINSITDYTKLQREADSLREKVGEYENKLFSGNLNATQYAKYQQLLESAEKELELYEDRLSEIARGENEQSRDKEEFNPKMLGEQLTALANDSKISDFDEATHSIRDSIQQEYGKTEKEDKDK